MTLDDIYTALCDRRGCLAERAPDGLTEVHAFVGFEVVTVRVHLCEYHRDLAAVRHGSERPVLAA